MKKRWLQKVTGVTLAAVFVFSSMAMPAQAGFNHRWGKMPSFLKEENSLTRTNVQTIKDMVTGLAETNFDDIQIEDYYSVFNVDSQETFFLYPVSCDGVVRYTANVSKDGTVSVTSNVDALEAITDQQEPEALLYVDDGVYYAASEDNTTALYEEGFVIENDVYSFEDKTYDEKLDTMTENEANFESYDNLLLTTDRATYTRSDVNMTGLWDWLEPQDTSYRAAGQTVTKKCGITNFLLQGNYGLCWACTVGTITNFMTGRNLTGKNVADMMGIGYDDGATMQEMRTALSRYGLSFNIYNNKLPFSQIKNNVNADKPFGICMQASNAGHAITGYGYSYNTGNTSSYASTNLVYAWDSNGYQISFAQNARNINTSGYRFSWYGSLY